MTAETPPAAELDAETLAFAARVFNLARHGDADELAALLDQGLPPNLRNDKGDTLLMLAAYNGNAPAVAALLARGADPDSLNDRGQVPLAGAAFKGELAIADMLLKHGAAVDGPTDGSGDRSPLMVAAMFDRVDIAELLLAHGADPGLRDKGGLGIAELTSAMGAEKVPALLARRKAQQPTE